MRMSKKAGALILAAMLGAGVLAGCGQSSGNSGSGSSADSSAASSGTEKASTGEKILVCGSTGYFAQETLDPASGWDGWYWQYDGVLETLFQLDNSYAPQKVLVEDYKKVDDVTWEFTIKDNVKFQNGENVTAESVKKCFERTLKINDRAKEQIYFDSITAKGQVLTIKTKEPNPTLLNDLTDPLWTVYDSENSDFKNTVYGTGPYIVDSFNPGVEIDLVRFDDYWGGTPKIDKVVCKQIGDADALAMAVQNKEIDIAAPMPSSGIPIFQGKEGFVVDSVLSARCNSLDYNMKSKTVGDFAVRKAIAMTIDREGICSQIYAGLATPSYGFFPESFAYGGTDGMDLDVKSRDVEGAKKVLEEAGWVDSDGDGIREKDGVKLSAKMVVLASRKELAQIGDVMQSDLKDIGMDLKVDTLESTDGAMKKADMELSTFNMSPTGNAQYYFNTRLVTGASGNEGGYSNKEFDALAKKLEGTFDENERNQIIKDATKIVMDEHGVDVILHQKLTYVYNDEVKNFTARPSEYYLIDGNIDLDR